MKHKNIISLMVLFISFSYFACTPKLNDSKQDSTNPVEVTIQDGLLEQVDQKSPKEVFVYEILPGNPQRWLNKFSGILDIKGETRDKQDLISIKSGSLLLEVRKISNTVFYGNMDKLWKAEPSPNKTKFDVPENRESERIATNWLQKFGFDAQAITDLDISMTDELFEITRPENPNNVIQSVVGKNVEVRRTIGGLKVHGPGSKIKFYLGSEGNLDGMTAVWRQVIPQSAVLGHNPKSMNPKGRNYKIMNAKKAFSILKKNPLDQIPISLVDKIEINEVELAYYARSASEPQKFLQPVYVFRGTAYSTLPDDRKSEVPYEQYIVALKKPLETIWPIGKDFKPEKRKKDMNISIEQDEDEKGEGQ